jgi:UDPglucose 6-dehydrogenase
LHAARSLGANPDLADATDRVNRYQVERVLHAVTSRAGARSTIGILGLAYKPDTAVIEESQGVAVAERLLDAGHPIVGYDPKALAAALARLAGRMRPAATAEECVRAAEFVLVMTPWPEFGGLAPDAFVRPGRRITVLDCWRILPAADLQRVADIVYIGQGEQSVTATAF